MRVRSRDQQCFYSCIRFNLLYFALRRHRVPKHLSLCYSVFLQCKNTNTKVVNATYYCNGTEYPATIRLDNVRLSITFSTGTGTAEVFWQYRDIVSKETPRGFSYLTYPPQSLEVLDHNLAEDLRSNIAHSKKAGRGGRFGPLAKVALIIVFLFTILYVALVPWLAGVLATRFPRSYEQKLGDQVYASLKSDFTIDQPATAAINRFFDALEVRSDYPINIVVVKGDVVNAFALPGGHIVVYDKLLNALGSYEELAALLSHEYIHVQNRHTVRSLFRQMGSTIFLSLLLGDAGAVSSVVLGNANELKNLSYSRRLESEADAEGVALLAKRGIDCTGFVRLFKVLEQQGESSTVPAEWMSSHPNLQKRIRQVQEHKSCGEKPPVKNERLHHLFLQLKTAE